jgi:hypothetical protein
MTFQHPFQLSSNTPSNAFQRPTVTHPHTPRGVGSAPLEDGAQLGPKWWPARGPPAAKCAIFFGSVARPNCLFKIESPDLLSGARTGVTC